MTQAYNASKNNSKRKYLAETASQRLMKSGKYRLNFSQLKSGNSEKPAFSGSRLGGSLTKHRENGMQFLALWRMYEKQNMLRCLAGSSSRKRPALKAGEKPAIYPVS